MSAIVTAERVGATFASSEKLAGINRAVTGALAVGHHTGQRYSNPKVIQILVWPTGSYVSQPGTLAHVCKTWLPREAPHLFEAPKIESDDVRDLDNGTAVRFVEPGLSGRLVPSQTGLFFSPDFRVGSPVDTLVETVVFSLYLTGPAFVTAVKDAHRLRRLALTLQGQNGSGGALSVTHPQPEAARWAIDTFVQLVPNPNDWLTLSN
ncbi:hypothetical protein BJX70DRAFT_399854 [Aspergillus crustosus]